MTDLRELDRKIAEKLGYETGSVGSKLVYKKPGGCGTYECQRMHAHELPLYSTSWEAMGQLIEEMEEDWDFRLWGPHQRRYDKDSAVWECEFQHKVTRAFYAERAESGPITVARAALQALGGKDV